MSSSHVTGLLCISHVTTNIFTPQGGPSEKGQRAPNILQSNSGFASAITINFSADVFKVYYFSVTPTRKEIFLNKCLFKVHLKDLHEFERLLTKQWIGYIKLQ